MEEDGTVIQRHQDHLRIRSDPDMTQQVASDIQDTVLSPETVVTLGTNDQPNHPESQPAAAAEQPVESNPQRTRPAQKRTPPGHLKVYLCEL